MTDHIGDGNQMVPDLDALKKLADAFDSGAYSTSGAIARTYGAGGKIRAAQDIKALIAELKEARTMAHTINRVLSPQADRTFDLLISQSQWAVDTCRAFLAKAQGGE